TDPFQMFMDRFAVQLGAGIGSSVSLDGFLPQEEGNVKMR
ncbi:MAG: protease-4, partial [Psychrobacter glaciei]